MIPASLAITDRRDEELNKLFHIASLPGGERFRHAFNSMTIDAYNASQTGGPLGKKKVRNYLKLLQQSISSAPNIHWQYEILVNAMVARRQLNLSGHRGTSKKIKAVLRQWAARVRASEVMEPVAKQALLRWIKEASW